MPKIRDLYSDEPKIVYTKKELDLIILPYIEKAKEEIKKEYTEIFKNISKISKAISYLNEENERIRTEIRGFDGNKINENNKNIKLFLSLLSKNFTTAISED